MAPTNAARAADVAVIGAGVIGLASAYELARRGLRVVIVERTAIGAGASGLQPGGVRQQWASRVNCLLARESLAVYRELGERLGTRLRPRFSACGYAFVAHSAARLGELADTVALQNELGIPSCVLGPAELAEAIPDLDPGELSGGSWCAEDGYFDRAQEPVEAYAEAALAAGTALVRAEADALVRDGQGWRVELRGAPPLSAGAVLVAAAHDSVRLVAPLGADLPLRVEPRHLFLSERIGERLLEPLVVASELGLAAKQLADGRVLASDLDAAGDPALDAGRWRANVRAGFRRLLPRLEPLSFVELVSGSYDMTPDRNPLLGELPGEAGVWLAAGFSGHGFMLAPAVSRRLAAAIAGEPHDPLLDAFRPDRFDGAAPVAEAQVI